MVILMVESLTRRDFKIDHKIEHKLSRDATGNDYYADLLNFNPVTQGTPLDDVISSVGGGGEADYPL